MENFLSCASLLLIAGFFLTLIVCMIVGMCNEARKEKREDAKRALDAKYQEEREEREARYAENKDRRDQEYHEKRMAALD